MKHARYILAMCMLVYSMQARADCTDNDSNICQLVNDVKTIFGEITGDVTTMASDLAAQVSVLHQQEDVVGKTVADTFDALKDRQGPFKIFVTAPDGGWCDPASPCGNFRSELDNFVTGIAALAPWLPQIANSGLGHGQLIVDLIDHTPPLLLFGPYEILSRIPDWQNLPTELTDLVNLVGDPDAFSVDTSQLGAAAAKSVATTKAWPPAQPLSSNTKLGNTAQFCRNHNRTRPLDPVLLNRVRHVLFLAKAAFDDVSEFAPEDKTLVVGGEGTSVMMPTKGLFVTVATVVDAINDALDTYRANLDVCKQIETDVAQAHDANARDGIATNVLLRDYWNESSVQNAYWVVKPIVDFRAGQYFNEVTPYTDLSAAQAAADRQDWRQAYADIVRAYAAMQ